MSEELMMAIGYVLHFSEVKQGHRPKTITASFPRQDLSRLE